MAKNILFVVLLAAGIVLASCTIPAPTATTDAAQPTVAPAPTQPTAEPAAEPAAPSVDLTSCGEVDFSDFVGKSYELIAKIDVQVGKVPQNSTNATIVADEALLYATGAYPGGRWPTGLIPLVVDGQTGVFCIPAGTVVTVNFVGAYVPLSSFNADAQINLIDDMAEACVPTAEVLDLLNSYAQTDGEKLFRELDALVNVEGAPYLGARFRPEPLAAKTYRDLVPATAVMWTQTGQVGDAHVELAQGLGKSVYLNTEPELVMSYAHTGLLLCEPMNPASQLTYWGQ